MRSSQFVYGGGLAWREYLQAKEFEASLHQALSDNTARLVASNDEIAAHISRSTQLVAGAIEELGATFSWGFGQVLGALGAVNDSLDSLLRIARTPSQTWAYEQFEIARSAFRKGLYPESLKRLRHAIAGFGGNPGYDLDFRFHLLEGTILLGSFRNADPETVDPAAAERSFLMAARYARGESNPDAARALVGASQAAYVQGKVDVALEHAREALSTSGQSVEAHYQAAKCLMHLDRPGEARSHIDYALVADAGYALKMLSDGDFRRHQATVMDRVESYRIDVSRRLETRAKRDQAAITEIIEASPNNDLTQEARRVTESIAGARRHQTLSAWLRAEAEYEEGRLKLASRVRQAAQIQESTASSHAEELPIAFAIGFVAFLGGTFAVDQATAAWAGELGGGCVGGILLRSVAPYLAGGLLGMVAFRSARSVRRARIDRRIHSVQETADRLMRAADTLN